MRCKYLAIFLIVVFAVVFCSLSVGFASIVDLGSARDFAVLGAAGLTNTGSTVIYKDLGLYPGTSITGFFGSTANEGPGLVTGGTVHQTDSVAQLAKSNALAAYNFLAGLSFTDHYLIPTDLGGLTLNPGVYRFDSSAGLTGALNLDFNGNPNADFIFQIGSTLTTGSDSSVNVINGGSLSGVYWQVGSSATLGTGTMFAGNILAHQSITLTTAADILCGRAIALNGAVTMDNNRISNNNSLQDFGSGRSDFGSYGFSGAGSTPPVPEVVPEPSTMLLLGLGSVATAFIRARRKKLNLKT